MSNTNQDLNAGSLRGKLSSLEIRLARTPEELHQAFRLRYEVFAEEEQNENLLNNSGLETDEFDAYCDHVIVWDDEKQQVVGTYRLLSGQNTGDHITFYSETEFNLPFFREQREKVLELGRSCVAPDYRNGRVIGMLWEGIASYLSKYPHQYLIGCASFPFHSLEECNQIYTMLKKTDRITDRYGVTPLTSHRVQGLTELEMTFSDRELFRMLPPLMKGYLWLGAELAGEPAYDPIFNTVDYLVVLDTNCITDKYKRHFLPSV